MIELLIVTLIVLWSALYVFKKVFPKTAFKVLMHLAKWCDRHGLTAISKKIMPVQAGGCGGGCGCSTDQPAKAPDVVQVVKWK